MIRSHFIRNPFTYWLRSFYHTLRLEFVNRKKRLRLGIMTNIKNTNFGFYNSISDEVFLDQVSLGDFTYISHKSNLRHTTIGKFTCIGPNVKCGMGSHPSRTFVSVHPAFYSILKQSSLTFADKDYFEEIAPIEIGNDVWIGANVVINNGVKICDGAIIAAGAVVTKDVSPYSIAGGVPAKVIRYRFSDVEIKYLLEIKWWNFELVWMKQNYKLFHDIKKFRAKMTDEIQKK